MAAVEPLIQNAINNATNFSKNAVSLLNEAATAAMGFAWVSNKEIQYNVNIPKPNIDTKVADFLDSYVMPVRTAVKPTFNPIFLPELPTIPDAPVINTSALFQIDRPTTNIAPFTGVVPTPNTQALVDEASALTKPNIINYDAPLLSDVKIRALPTVTLPTFDKTYTGDALEPITDLEQKYRDAYAQALPAMKAFIDDGMRTWIDTYSPNHTENFALMESKLAEGIRTGTALPEQYTTALRNSARKEIDANHAAQEQAALTDNEKRGFFTAPGAVSAGLRRVKQASGAALANMNTEIFKQRKEQEVQHIQFCITTEASLQQGLLQMMMGYASTLSGINQNAMAFAQGVVGAIAQMTQLIYERAKTEMAVYSLEIQLYETRLKAALTVLDEYRMELEVAKLNRDIDMIAIQLWTAKWDTQIKQMDVYIKEIDAIATRGNLLKLQLDVFGQTVSSYNAQLGAKELEVRIYEAALHGDSAKLEGLLSQLKIYQTEVETINSRNQIQIAHSQAIIANDRNLIDVYNAELQGWQAEITAESARFGGRLQGYTAQLDAVKTANALKMQSLDADVTVAKLNLDALKTVFDANLSVEMKNADLFMNGVQIHANNALGAGNAFGSMAGAALSAQNSMITLQESV